MLRSDVTAWTPEDPWRICVQPRQAEAASRAQKSEIAIRPTCHQHTDRVRALILACSPAYVLRKTLHGWQDRTEPSPATIQEELRRIGTLDVFLPFECGGEMRLRCGVRPGTSQAAPLDRLVLEVPRTLRRPSDLAEMWR